MQEYTTFRAPTSLPLQFCSEMEVSVKLLYVKMGVIGGRNARDSHADLCEALGGRALLYRTITTRVQEFKSGRGSTSAMHRTGPCVSVHTDVSSGRNGTEHG